MVFRLPLRQTEGFLDSLLRLMELDLKAPDHTTLSRRNKDVDVPAPTRVHDGPIHLIVDATGLKLSGAGEWHAHRYKSSKACRVWRKLHVGVDDDGFIVTAKLTKSSEDDPSTVPCLLEQVDSSIRRFTADGAYDTRSAYELLGEVGTADIKMVIPPRRGAVPSEGARGHMGAAERDPRDDSESRAPRMAAGVTVSTTGRRRESVLQVQADARRQPSRVRLRIAEAGGDDRVQRIEPEG